MARLAYADLTTPAIQDLVTQITAERGSVIHLYQMLLHSPAVAQGWLNHLTGIRLNSQVPGDLRELIIMRVALLNRAPYEADQHAPIALKEGLSQAQLDALADWENHPQLFTDTERAILAYTDAMTLQVQVPQAIYAAIAEQFDAQLVVEITATIATYNMVSRFLEALQIHSDDVAAPSPTN